MPREIRVVIDKTGNAVVQVRGMTGPGCTKLTEQLVASLALKPEDAEQHICGEYHVAGGDQYIGEAPRMVSFGGMEGGDDDGGE